MGWRVVERLAGYVCLRGAWEAAVRRYAAAEQGRSLTHDLVDPAERELRMWDRTGALDSLGPDAFATAEQVGSLLSLPRTLELAHTVLTQTRSSER